MARNCLAKEGLLVHNPDTLGFLWEHEETRKGLYSLEYNNICTGRIKRQDTTSLKDTGMHPGTSRAGIGSRPLPADVKFVAFCCEPFPLLFRSANVPEQAHAEHDSHGASLMLRMH